MTDKLFGSFGKNDGVIHFIGVGGIGMSGLAEVLARSGFKVQGSDLGQPYTEDKLREAGVTLFVGHDAAHVSPEVRIVVLSTAVKDGNVELEEARRRGLRIIHRADVLAEIMTHYQTIAVSGTHGKTSTTALIFAALRAAGLNVGIINGGVLDDLHTNAALPAAPGGWLVVEADESDASFLKLKPTVAVVTNIEPEHMDTYGSEEKLVKAFVDFISSAEEAVVCADDPNVLVAMAQADDKDIVTYGLADDADAYAAGYTPQRGADGQGQMAFDAVLRGATLEDVVVNLPGVHYVLNSLAALAVAQLLKLDVTKAAEGLETFAGVGRRFTRLGRLGARTDGALVVDDYGHHPTEISVTLEAAKTSVSGKVVAVIQPHRYTRLRDLMDDFAGCARVADACVLLPVYAAGESPIPGVSHEALADKMNLADGGPEAVVVNDEAGLRAALSGMHLGADDAVVCLGAGSISGMARHLVQAA